MQSSMFLLAAFAMLLALVHCSSDSKDVSEYEIKQDLIGLRRGYQIKSKTNAPTEFTTENELFTIGKNLSLLENGKHRYSVKHDVLNLMSTWDITDSEKDQKVGTIQNELRFAGSKMTANGPFGHYTIEGNFGNHEFTIEKDGKKVAEVHKKNLHLHHTYGLTVYGDADRALMILFTIIVNEIREH